MGASSSVSAQAKAPTPEQLIDSLTKQVQLLKQQQQQQQQQHEARLVSELRSDNERLRAQICALEERAAAQLQLQMEAKGLGCDAAAFAASAALSLARRDDARVEEVFKRHMRKKEERGLSQAALVAALQELDAPVLRSSDIVDEDELFRRADTNASGFVDVHE